MFMCGAIVRLVFYTVQIGQFLSVLSASSQGNVSKWRRSSTGKGVPPQQSIDLFQQNTVLRRDLLQKIRTADIAEKYQNK